MSVARQTAFIASTAIDLPKHRGKVNRAGFGSADPLRAELSLALGESSPPPPAHPHPSTPGAHP